MTALMLYFYLNADMQWRFMAIEEAGNMAYCKMLADDVKRVFSNKPGNIQILCADDRRVEA
jgi:hypothetical protein